MKRELRPARRFRPCGPGANAPASRKASKLSVTVTSPSPRQHGPNPILSAPDGTRGCRKCTTASCAISRRRSPRIAVSSLTDRECRANCQFAYDLASDLLWEPGQTDRFALHFPRSLNVALRRTERMKKGMEFKL